MTYFVFWCETGCRCGCTPDRSGDEEFEELQIAEKELFSLWYEGTGAYMIEGSTTEHRDTDLLYVAYKAERDAERDAKLAAEAKGRRTAERAKERRELARLKEKYSS